MSRLKSARGPIPPGTNPLTPLFDTLGGPDPEVREFSLAIQLVQALSSDPPLETRIPVRLYPRSKYDTGALVQHIIDAVAQQERPAWTGKGALSFEVGVYSSADPSLQRPLLLLRDLVSPIG
jgi:hypothetical protein